MGNTVYRRSGPWQANAVVFGLNIVLLPISGCSLGLSDDDASCAEGYYLDEDNDGFGTGEQVCPEGDVARNNRDCDDSDPNIFPTAQEICDEVDNDCDGRIDDDDDSVQGDHVYYVDSDQDGVGAGIGVVYCQESPPSQYTTIEGDCDDANAAVSPQQTEDCTTAFDDNCDGDPNNQGAIGCTSFYEDLDGDGFGGPTTACLCTLAEGFADKPADCNDAAADVYPGNLEVCSNKGDDDCDGSNDDRGCALDGIVSGAALTLLFDTKAAAWGHAMVGSGDLLAIASTPDEGSPEILFFEGGMHTVDARAHAEAVWQGTDGFAWTMDMADLDGDRVMDLVVGSPIEGGNNEGAVYIIPTNTTSSAGLKADIVGTTNSATFGWSIDTGGDFDGDGSVDLAAASPGPGTVSIFTTPQAAAVEEDGVVFDGFSVNALAHADIDDDGYDDLALGIPGSDTSVGVMLVVPGGAALEGGDMATAATVSLTGVVGGLFGIALEGGDLDRDGRENDLVVGGASSASVVLGGTIDLVLEDAGLPGFGGVLSMDGDVDGDDVPDLLVGSNDDKVAGANLYLVPPLATRDARLPGGSPGFGFGWSMGMADLNDDAYADVIIGQPNGNKGAGAAAIFYGGLVP